MKEWFIPINDLVSKIKILMDNNQAILDLDGHKLGSIHLHIPKFELELAEFKKRVIQQNARYSSTVVLKTLCGCTQRIEQPSYKDNQIMMPLKCTPRFCVGKELDEIPKYTTNRRVFRETHKHDSMGLRIFEEIED